MKAFDRKTERLYYSDMWLRRASAKIVRIGDDFIELDATVAFPEGGGQEADVGYITTSEGLSLRFVGAKSFFGRMLFLDGFPNIQVEGIVRHIIHPDDLPALQRVGLGEAVEVQIDIERRAALSLSHTASHLLHVGISAVRPDAVPGIFGCHIKTDAARFDFHVSERFTAEELSEISAVTNQLVQRDSPIRLYAHELEPGARYWLCEANVIPCGGTHIESTGPVGRLELRRKSLGAGKERITCEFPDARLKTDKYHT